ncbi:Transcriptional regulator, MerR family [hydrothermal vent metagenome]|uniref:Mercuric resistance operon regulatory protein n=1 Tax=hydrothermal vent metagenome TaxID=652676 RepID=A0A3B0WRD7_9ZZZZ
MIEIKPELTIGRLAKLAAVNIETIRYYQRIGLIAEPAAPASGYRKYSYKVAENIRFIKRAQHLGFSLREIADLLNIGDGHCDDVRVRAEKKRNKIEQQIRDLQTLRTTLDQLICECHSGKNGQHCPIVESLLAQDMNASV